MYNINTRQWHIPKRYAYKIWLMMRLTTVILIASFMQVSAGGFAQKISMSKLNAPLKDVIKEIRTQSGYNFVYTASILKGLKPITINVKSVEFEEVLKQVFSNQPLTYVIDNNTVIVTEKKGSVLDNIQSRIGGYFRQDSVIFKGQVLNEYGDPLKGATVRARGSKKLYLTTDKGAFVVFAAPDAILQVSYVGYATQELKMRREDAGVMIKFNMKPATKDLNEVSIASNGFQDIPKERSTGSFEVITSKQLQHSTDPNLLRRLEGITTSMDFRNDLIRRNSSLSRNSPASRSPLTNLTIRGRNTLTTSGSDNNSGRPLVVIDGIPSPYSIDLVNPNDVESMTILKDAAAASIWGSRAANGVIVIKTKKGRYQNPLQIDFNANVNITDKPDLFYQKMMRISDYIDAQIFKYSKDYPGISEHTPDPVINAGQAAISPVAEIMDRQRRGQISPDQAKAEIDALRGNDVRNDLNKYFFRNAATQSYSLTLSGGTEKLAQRLSAGYDKILNNTVTSGANREVLNYSISAKPLAKLELQANVIYMQSNTSDQASGDGFAGINYPIGNIDFFPYSRIADGQGNPLSIDKSYSRAFLNLLNSTYGDKLLSYDYKPLEDINKGYTKSKLQNMNMNLGATYQILPELSANVTYNYNVSFNESTDLNRVESWFMRDKINLLTNPVNAYDLYTFLPLDPGIRNLPVGGQYVKALTRANNQTLRGQVNFNKNWNDKHSISALAGMDIYRSYSRLTSNGHYGYNEKNLSYAANLNSNYFYFLLFANPISGAGLGLLAAPSNFMSDVNGRTVSYFTNAAYTYANRYTLSASLRRDLSNVFSSAGNNGGTPFYSVGASWNINQEKFYHLSWLPVLKLRATYGYNGNTNPAASASSIITYTPQNQVTDGNLLGYADIQNPSNIKLRPEQTAVLNFGLDFGVKGGRLSGSVEYYEKRTKDLLANNAADPSIGFNQLDYNSGNLFGKGIDLILNSMNIQTGQFRWNSNLLFSYNKVKVTSLYAPIVYHAGTLVSSPLFYTQGDDLSRLFAYRWAGLDPNTGDPRGYLNGNIVTIDNSPAGGDAISDINNQPKSSLRYFGSAVPVYYGAFRNTFSYSNFSVSANLLYKLGYWFRRPISNLVQYNNLYTDGNVQGGEYTNRWQNPGDEKFTNVPSAVYPGNSSRDNFYRFSEINVLKGDHIRLQEINLSYTLDKKNWFIKNPRIYANVSNLGVIWRANKLGVDPEVLDLPLPRTYSLGFSANF